MHFGNRVQSVIFPTRQLNLGMEKEFQLKWLVFRNQLKFWRGNEY